MNDLYVKITGKNVSSDTGGIHGAGNYLLYLRSARIYRTSCYSDTRNPRYYRSYHIKYQYPKMREGIGACN